MSKRRFILLSNHGENLLRFGIVGGTTYVLTILAFSLLDDLLNVGHGLSATGAYSVGITYHFVMNRKFTFRAPQGHLMKQATKYALLTAANYLMTFTLFRTLLSSMCMMPLILFAFSVAITTVTGYLVMRFWIFPLRTSDETSTLGKEIGL